MTSAAAALSAALTPLRRLSFSMPSFIHGLGGGVCVIALMGVWMGLRGDDTLTRIQADRPSKTAIIEHIKAEPKPVVVVETPKEEEVAVDTHALAKAPIAGLFETSQVGQLPIADLRTGMTPFEAYKKPYTLVPGRPPIAILFVGAGLSESLSAGIVNDLPDTISIAVSPYSLTPGVWLDKIRAGGHEAWLTLPLQNDTYPEPDPGPNTILSSVSLEQNQDRLMKILASGAGYAGLISLDDHNFTAANTHIVPVLQQIFGRGLAFIDGRPDRVFFGADIAASQSYPYADSDMTIGEDLSIAAAAAALARAERIAHEKGQALVYVLPTPANIQAVEKWAPTLETRGLQLAPASALVKQ